MPERVDEGLLDVISQAQTTFSQVVFVLHINHSQELGGDVDKAIKLLKNSGVTVLSQTVLLKGVNDSAADLIELFLKLGRLGVQPYYLHHADNVRSAVHFQTTIEEGRRIYSQLKAKLSGWLIPQYVLDLPSGGGKVPLYNPESFSYSQKLLNFHGKIESHVQVQ